MALAPIPGYVEFFTDRDSWLVKQKTKIVLVIFGIFFVSMVMSCQELHYMVSGKVVDANLQTRVETEARAGEKLEHLVVGYTYLDGSQQRQRYIDMPLDWPGAHQQTVKVQYIPGGDLSRLLGQTNRVWVFIFLGSLVALVLGMLYLAKYG
jgi:hypothetical protein